MQYLNKVHDVILRDFTENPLLHALPSENLLGYTENSVGFLLNDTNLTLLAFLYKIDIKGFQNQQKIMLPPVGTELTIPTI